MKSFKQHREKKKCQNIASGVGRFTEEYADVFLVINVYLPEQ